MIESYCEFPRAIAAALPCATLNHRLGTAAPLRCIPSGRFKWNQISAIHYTLSCSESSDGTQGRRAMSLGINGQRKGPFPNDPCSDLVASTHFIPEFFRAGFPFVRDNPSSHWHALNHRDKAAFNFRSFREITVACLMRFSGRTHAADGRGFDAEVKLNGIPDFCACSRSTSEKLCL
jgi:hypothetical protein